MKSEISVKKKKKKGPFFPSVKRGPEDKLLGQDSCPQ